MKHAISRLFVPALLAALASPALATEQAPACKDEAVAQARKLLAFHSDGDDRAEVDASSVKALPARANPANRKQRFEVLEVMGFVYKGEYRMRLSYYTKGGQCVLMGQEILHLAQL
ncbi:hypothetical protein EBQ34_07335 [Vandammella animalimorsus]|uniref:Uncharacterized protein n=1 Tax=Vandammella animalimorsus TaxID=2029117 RepID=A0A3M6RL71_9BURK|nr:hypothetical protein [Vandammella animalimorsus]RMX15192.1 hypothetical protein EBQ34_07335 [Vandammella animalimorsus]